ncbi:hypothetical protein GCM10012275_02790 [Longimycelium tulufanense]|uniref:Uncharacterized protein n=1 Tax=Longimycelium tulufanense TaxID=907463 RepID=A0A8J3CBH6_9PSEU|nr:hypothetical protein [Longimycelium tulufanense]GGM35002.1 hypothetical protein GCM10012275_02790 [Longimycelium tulufanense]
MTATDPSAWGSPGALPPGDDAHHSPPPRGSDRSGSGLLDVLFPTDDAHPPLVSGRLGTAGTQIPPLPWALLVLLAMDLPLFLHVSCTELLGWAPAELGTIVFSGGCGTLLLLRAPALGRPRYRLLVRWGVPVVLLAVGMALPVAWPVPVAGVPAMLVSGLLAAVLPGTVLMLRRRSPWRPVRSPNDQRVGPNG